MKIKKRNLLIYITIDEEMSMSAFKSCMYVDYIQELKEYYPDLERNCRLEQEDDDIIDFVAYSSSPQLFYYAIDYALNVKPDEPVIFQASFGSAIYAMHDYLHGAKDVCPKERRVKVDSETEAQRFFQAVEKLEKLGITVPEDHKRAVERQFLCFHGGKQMSFKDKSFTIEVDKGKFSRVCIHGKDE